MEIFHYVRLIRRWLWLLVLAGFIGGGISFINRVSQQPTYKADTLIAIGGFIQSPNPDLNAVRIGFELTETFAQLVETQSVLEATLDNVVAPLEPDNFRQLISTRTLPNTSLLQISVTYTDPILSYELANELATQLILESPSNLTPEQRSQIELLNEQIVSLTQELSDLRGRLTEIDLLLTNVNSESERSQLQDERVTIVTQINQGSNNIGQFTNTVAVLQERTNSIEIVEEARIPESPINQNVISITILGAISLIAVTFSIVVTYEYINNTFHTTEEVSQALQKPILGSVSEYGNSKDSYQDKLLMNTSNPRILDEFRILRTNLLFSSNLSKPLYVLTSAMPNEGKTTISSNLSISLAMSGLNVLLIDADLRRPRIHEVFGLENSVGLTTMLNASLHQPSNDNLVSTEKDNEGELIWKKFIRQIDQVSNLWIMPSGFPVENPTELLGSTIMRSCIDNILATSNFDVIIIDTPPALGFPDSIILSVSLEAKIITVLRAGKTRFEIAKRLFDRLGQIQVDVAGIVLNQVNPQEEEYFNNNYYLDYYADY